MPEQLTPALQAIVDFVDERFGAKIIKQLIYNQIE